MKLTQTRLVTEDVARLVAFYEAVTGAGLSVGTPSYVEFGEPCAGLAIAGTGVQAVYGPDVVVPAANRSAILDFEVEDVDREFARLKGFVKDWVLAPTDQPWGNRAMLFRDPDGNLVNFYMPAKQPATARKRP